MKLFCWQVHTYNPRTLPRGVFSKTKVQCINTAITCLPHMRWISPTGYFFHIPLRLRHNAVEKTSRTFASKRLCLLKSFVKLQMVLLSWFMVRQEFYPTLCVFSVLAPKLGYRKHTTHWIKSYLTTNHLIFSIYLMRAENIWVALKLKFSTCILKL